MTSQDSSHTNDPLERDVEAAFDQVRDELGEDPQAAFDKGGLGQAPTDVPSESVNADQVEAEQVEELDPLTEAQQDLAQAQDELARARADYYNLQQEYTKYVRRAQEAAAGHREAGSQAVVEALIPVLDEIELARTHGDLNGPFEAMATKLEGVLTDKYGLERFGEVGEVFDPLHHEALMATESEEVSEPTVTMVLQPGYRLGERTVRAARVQVANPA
ncbi:nucleotide exchange factor GrpE [Actinomyces vulturis]|uniref:nucleotide exchange factor GrpE n=1 Tax=Actinomyces vulturis TaxID=1857645 RepID=UPI00083763AF|nr:nucleotide exchange factor GrpE [Actinomyces vulturis]